MKRSQVLPVAIRNFSATCLLALGVSGVKSIEEALREIFSEKVN